MRRGHWKAGKKTENWRIWVSLNVRNADFRDTVEISSRWRESEGKKTDYEIQIRK